MHVSGETGVPIDVTNGGFYFLLGFWSSIMFIGAIVLFMLSLLIEQPETTITLGHMMFWCRHFILKIVTNPNLEGPEGDIMSKKEPKIALVHEYLVKLGGGERVLKALLEVFPKADLFTLIYNRNSSPIKRKVKTSFLQNLPLAISKYQLYFWLMPKAIESFDFSKYDIIISDSHSFGKGIKKSEKTLHICFLLYPNSLALVGT